MDVEFLKYKFQDGYDGVITKTKFSIGVRHVQVLYMFLCSVVMGAMRGSVGIEVLAIADSSRRNGSHIQVHEWDARVQGTVLSSFFFGYALVLLPAELQLRRLGDKFVITSVLLINGALSAAMPTIVTRGSWAALCFAHLLLGGTQACCSPSNRALLAKWLPPSERRTFGCFIDAGIHLGLMAALPLAGMLSETRLGWELVFYSQAMMTFSMAALWALLTASSPDEHQAVGDFEKEYIKEASAGCRKKSLQKPWRSIVRSQQVWAVACAHAAANALFVFYLVDVPLYLKSTGLSLKESAQKSAVPFLALWMTHAATAPTLNWFFKTGSLAYLLNDTYLRKVINALGAFPVVIGLAILPNITAQWACLRFSVLIGTLGLLGFQYSGFIENIRDLSENYRGTLVVATSAVAGAAGAAVPLLTGVVLTGDASDPKHWRLTFSSLASLYALCNIVYVAFASGARPPWDDAGRYKFGYHNAVLAHDDSGELELQERLRPVAAAGAAGAGSCTAFALPGT